MNNDYGNYTLTYIDSVTYYNYLGSKAEALKNNESYVVNKKNRENYISTFSYPEQRIIGTNDLIDQIKNNKINLIKAYLSNVLENTKTPNFSIEASQNIKNHKIHSSLKNVLVVISKYQNRFFTIIGIILSIYFILKLNKKQTLYSLISLYIIYTIAISGISFTQGDRFHIVIFPFVIILIVIFIKSNINLYRKY